MGGELAMPACLATRKYVLFSLEEPVCQEDTSSDTSLGSAWKPYHFPCDLGGRTNWSRSSPPASDVCEGYPCTRVKFNLAIFLHSHSSVGKFTDTLPGVCSLEPDKGMSSKWWHWNQRPGCGSTQKKSYPSHSFTI